MKARFAIILIVLSTVGTPRAWSAAFSNLDFEAAMEPLPVDLVPVTNAFPGWRVYAGDLELTRVPYNAIDLSGANVSLFGRDGPPYIIEGSFTAYLYSGLVYTTPPAPGPVSLVQFGMVPADSRSLQFKGYAAEEIQISLGGSPINFIPLSTASNYVLYGVDISPFAGQELELRFTAPIVATQTHPFYRTTIGYLDSIEFSPHPIPEPGTSALLVCGGGALLAVYRWRRKTR